MRRFHAHLARALLQIGEALASPHIHALLAVVVHEKLREIGREYARANSFFGDDHRDIAAHDSQRRRDLGSDESAAEHGKPHLLVGEGA